MRENILLQETQKNSTFSSRNVFVRRMLQVNFLIQVPTQVFVFPLKVPIDSYIIEQLNTGFTKESHPLKNKVLHLTKLVRFITLK